MKHETHYFVAASLPEETKIILHDLCEELKRKWSFKSWVHPLDFHITLAFLGAASDEKIALTEKLVSTALSDQPIFSLVIESIGVFGREDAPRVLWAGLEQTETLAVLRNKVFHACEIAGFSLETRPFSPHITLSRRWVGSTPFRKKALDETRFSIPLEIKEVTMYKSNITASPKYEGLTTFSLK